MSSLAVSGSFYDERFVPLCLVKQALGFLKFFDQKPKPIDRLGGMNLCHAEERTLTKLREVLDKTLATVNPVAEQ